MAFNVTIKSVTSENITKGKRTYGKALVEYTYKGEPRKQTFLGRL